MKKFTRSILVGVGLLAFGCDDSRKATLTPSKALSPMEAVAMSEVVKLTGISKDSLVTDNFQRNDDGNWTAAVWKLPKSPGGFWFVEIDDHGTIVSFTAGE